MPTFRTMPTFRPSARPFCPSAILAIVLSLTGLGCDTGSGPGKVAGPPTIDGAAAREELAAAAQSYFERLKSGSARSVGADWDLKTLRETAYGDTYTLLDGEGQAEVDQLLERELGEILVAPALVDRLSGVSISRTEVDRQDDKTFWIALSLQLDDRELGELLLYAKQVDGAWRWSDLGRFGYLLSDELQTAQVVEGLPLEEHVANLSDHASKLALIYPDPTTMPSPPAVDELPDGEILP